MEERLISVVGKKLDVLIKLTAINALREKSFKEQIKILSDIGLMPKEIAELTGKKPNHVSVTLYEMKKGKTSLKSKRGG